MFAIAVEDRKVDARDVPRVRLLKEPPPRTGFLEPADYGRLRDALPEDLRPVACVAFYTGMREQEILRLRPEQVDLGAGEIRLDPGATKNDEARSMPLFGELLETLKMQLLRHAAQPRALPFLFFHDGGPILKSTLRKPWIRACVRAGLGTAPLDAQGAIQYVGYKGLTFHDLRRSGVRNLVRAGVPEKVAMAITGHRTRAVFDRYNIVSGKDLKDAGRKMEVYFGSEAEPPKPVTRLQ